MPELGLGLANGAPSPPQIPLWRTQLLFNPRPSSAPRAPSPPAFVL